MLRTPPSVETHQKAPTKSRTFSGRVGAPFSLVHLPTPPASPPLARCQVLEELKAVSLESQRCEMERPALSASGRGGDIGEAGGKKDGRRCATGKWFELKEPGNLWERKPAANKLDVFGSFHLAPWSRFTSEDVLRKLWMVRT